MRKGKLCSAIAAGLLAVLISACGYAMDTADTAGSAPERAEESIMKDERVLTIVEATDMHYLSPALTDGGAAFRKLVNSGDGKMPECSGEIMDALLNEVLEMKPDALVLSGDLTFNGELVSLTEMAEKLRPVKAAGIPVLVLPGNHDIDYRYAAGYFGDSARKVENVSQAAFLETCREFGYDDALDACAASFSYVYALSDRVRLLMLDANTEDYPGGLDDETLAWAEEALLDAEADGAEVVTVTHQNVLRPSELIYYGFVMANEDRVRSLLEKHGVRVNLSGHSHIQHTATDGVLTDYQTGSLTVYPLHYAILTVWPDRAKTYETREIDVCREEAKERMTEMTRRQVGDTLQDLEIPEEAREAMLDLACRVNLATFAGESVEAFYGEDAWKLWETYGQTTFWYLYMKSTRKDR